MLPSIASDPLRPLALRQVFHADRVACDEIARGGANLPGGVSLDRLDDLPQWPLFPRLDEQVDVIRHDNPGEKPVA